MLIAINGKIGSGKDTVGKIIQHLTSEWADEEFKDTDMLDVRNDWKIKKFAGKLKQIASLLTGIDVESFEDQDFKNTTLSEEWDFADDDAPDNIMTVRMFLQKLGTEAMRNGLHTNVWVNALFADYKTVGEKLGFTSYSDRDIKEGFAEKPKWIITDMRFPNEMEAVKERKGITIRVVRPEFMVDGKVITKDLHPSETSLDSAEFDYTIVNDSTIEDLVKKVKEILEKEGII